MRSRIVIVTWMVTAALAIPEVALANSCSTLDFYDCGSTAAGAGLAPGAGGLIVALGLLYGLDQGPDRWGGSRRRGQARPRGSAPT